MLIVSIRIRMMGRVKLAIEFAVTIYLYGTKYARRLHVDVLIVE